jgi:O-antigen/teichoic acid export membrane protein
MISAAPSQAHESSTPPGEQTAAATPHSQSGRRVLFHNVTLLAGSQVFSWCLTLAWTLVVPRRLGAGQVGVYTLGQAATGVLLMVVGLGLRPFLVREIAVDHNRASRLLGAAIVLRACLTIPALAATLLVIRFGHFSADEALAVFLGWTMCVFYVASEPILAGFQAIERMRYLAYAALVTKSAVTVSTVALVIVGVRADGLLLASVVIVAISMVLTIIWSRTYFKIDLRVAPRDLWRLLVESLPYSSMAVFFTFYLWIDSLMLGLMTPSTVVGWYGLPTRLFGSLMIVPVVLSTAWLPRLARAHQVDARAMLRGARPAIELVLILSLPMCVGTILVARSLVHALYGSGFSGSVPVLILLAFCLPPMYFNVMACQILVASKRQWAWTRVMALACVINPVANLFLIPHFERTDGNGAIGASLAMILTEVALATIGAVLVHGVFTAGSAMRLLKGAAATAGMAVAVAFALRLDLLAAIGTGLVTFPALALALRVLSDEERQLLSHALKRITRQLPPLRVGVAERGSR